MNIVTHSPHLVTFTEDPATKDVTATATGDPRRVTWVASTGNAHIDEDRREFGHHLSRHAFEVQTRELFSVVRVCLELLPCCGEGHGWVHHYGWNADGRFADIPTRCTECNTSAVAS